jgi:hypothetical protein
VESGRSPASVISVSVDSNAGIEKALVCLAFGRFFRLSK